MLLLIVFLIKRSNHLEQVLVEYLNCAIKKIYPIFIEIMNLDLFLNFLRKQNIPLNASMNVPINLNETESLVLEIIRTNNRLNKSQIAKMIDKSEMTVQRAINKLMDEKLIKRVGSNKTGYWQIA